MGSKITTRKQRLGVSIGTAALAFAGVGVGFALSTNVDSPDRAATTQHASAADSDSDCGFCGVVTGSGGNVPGQTPEPTGKGGTGGVVTDCDGFCGGVGSGGNVPGETSKSTGKGGVGGEIR